MEKYTVLSNPMPSPLASAMRGLLDRDAHINEIYPDNQGHHLVMSKGALRIHITLVLDWHADGVDWADGDLSWEVTDGVEELTLARWSDVCRTFEAKVAQS